MKAIRRAIAFILLISVYGSTWLVAKVCGMIPRRRWKPNGRILVIGTFFNPNWYLSHLAPLARSGVQEVILVVEEPQLPLQGVRFLCWPRWISRLLGRPGIRAIWVILAGLRFQPDLYMGYHLGPGACTALMAGKLMGRPTCYQMTGGPVEIIGGGIYAAESIGAALRHPSRLIEAMSLAVVRQFELLVVRGSKGRDFLASHGITRRVAVITGSVQNYQPASSGVRDIHLIFVGRLSLIKRVEQFIKIVSLTKQAIPDIRARIVGDGSLRENLLAYAEELGLLENIEFLGQRKDVGSLLARSKIFVLTSQSEGLSIAMAEAMIAGAVPVVSNVGDLGDLVTDGENGCLIEPGNVDAHTKAVVLLLQNDTLWSQFSNKAVEAARQHCGIEVVTEKWRRHLRDTVSQASGCWVEEILN